MHYAEMDSHFFLKCIGFIMPGVWKDTFPIHKDIEQHMH